MERYLAKEERLLERIHWLINLRWIAIIGVALTAFLVNNIFRIPIKALPIYCVAAGLAVYNAAFILMSQNRSMAPNVLANAQISLDLLSLTLLIHFSGGIENPFIFYFIFHMIIASILLSRRDSFLQATFAVALFLILAFLEYFGILPHHCLKGFVPQTLHDNLLYISGTAFVFISTIYIAVYMATSITKKLREKDRIKSEYVLRVTHDIKEHLSAVESCIEPVTEGITGPLNDKQKDLLTRAEERAGKLISFVRALLEITKIKLTKRVEPETFSFAEFLKSISEDIGAKAESKGLTFNSYISPSIKEMTGVRVYIEEAIQNLLLNSLKYTPKGGRIELKAEDKGKNFLVEIRDTGIGIPKDELGHLFEEFYRGRNAKMIEREGTGLGLSIAKEIVDMHKGKIWVDSEEGKGTVFYIEFPKEAL